MGSLGHEQLLVSEADILDGMWASCSTASRRLQLEPDALFCSGRCSCPTRWRGYSRGAGPGRAHRRRFGPCSAGGPDCRRRTSTRIRPAPCWLRLTSTAKTSALRTRRRWWPARSSAAHDLERHLHLLSGRYLWTNLRAAERCAVPRGTHVACARRPPVTVRVSPGQTEAPMTPSRLPDTKDCSLPVTSRQLGCHCEPWGPACHYGVVRVVGVQAQAEARLCAWGNVRRPRGLTFVRARGLPSA